MRSLLLLREDQALGCFAKKSVIFFWKSAFFKSSLLIVHRCSRICNLPAIHSMTSSKFLKVKGFCRMAFLTFSLTRGMKVTPYNPSAAIASRMFSMHAHTGKGFKPLLDFLVGAKTKNLNQDLNLGGRTILKFWSNNIKLKLMELFPKAFKCVHK